MASEAGEILWSETTTIIDSPTSEEVGQCA
jgi:hypothetical protein